MFKLFAELIGVHLDARQRLALSEQALAAERERAELREQFIAVLGHDLRNPLAAIADRREASADNGLPANTARLAQVIQNSATPHGGPLDNVLDFARGRLGGGLSLRRVVEGDWRRGRWSR